MNAALDMAAYNARVPAVSGPLTLQDARDFALQYNIDIWIAALERKYQHELATQARLKMLPSLIVGIESTQRSRLNAASSQSLATGDESLVPSFSSVKRTDTWDVSATWNLLDFGISFLRARQQGNWLSIAAERERRVRQNITFEVTRAYWNAVTARESAIEAERISEEVARTLEKIGRQIDEKTLPEIDGLMREITLLSHQEELRRYKRLYLKDKTELATLIGLPPGAEITLAEVDLDEPVAPLAVNVAELELEALSSRPELFEKDLKEAIFHDEARVALAEMFPSLSLFWRHDRDRNRFLVFNEWNTAGLRAAWDLLAIPHQIRRREAVKLQTELIAKRRIAIAVGILTQLHLSLIDYDEAVERRALARTISDKRHALLVAIERTADAGKSHGGELLEHRMKYLRARAVYLTAHANLMVSRARLLNTIGRNPQTEEEEFSANEIVLPDPAQPVENPDETP